MDIKQLSKNIMEALSNVEDPSYYEGVVEKQLWEGFKSFLNEVHFMRQAQITYFQYRTTGNLELAKRREKNVDEMLDSLKKQRNPEKQKKLSL